MMEIFDWSRLLRDISDLVFLALIGALEVRMLLCLSFLIMLQSSLQESYKTA